MDSFQIRVGRKVKEFREKNRLTQDEAAKKAGLNTNYYSRIERGEVNLTTKKLNNILKILKNKLTLPM